MYHVDIVKQNKAGLKPFIDLPFSVYQGNALWAPPVKSEQADLLTARNNELLSQSVHRFFIAYDDLKPVARVLVGIDERRSAVYGEKTAWFSLFETREDPDAVRLVFDAAVGFLKTHGVKTLVGPLAPTYDFMNRGVLVHGFDLPPVLDNPYHLPYYDGLLTACGFRKEKDYLAYDIPIGDIHLDSLKPLANRAMQRFDFSIRPMELSVRAAKQAADILAESAAEDDAEFIPTAEDMLNLFRRIRPFYVKEYSMMAFAKNRPVGVLFGFPDNTPYLKALKGKSDPLSRLLAAGYRHQVRTVRCPLQAVVPAYRKKAVNLAMIVSAMEQAKKRGVRKVEGGTVDESSALSVSNTLLNGGKHIKTYRLYRLDFDEASSRFS